MNATNQQLNIKFRYLTVVILVSLTSICFYLFHLQFNRGKDFSLLSNKNFIRFEKINSARGNIVDINYKLLATNRPVDNIYWIGTGNKKLSDSQTALASNLIKSFNLEPNFIEQIKLAEKKSIKFCLVKDISFNKLSELSENFSNDKNIQIERLYERVYPYKIAASHILGYMSLGSDVIGRMGLEFICENDLRGIPGEIIKKINSVGYNIEATQSKPPITGKTIETLLNIDLQLIAQRLFPEGHSGAFVLLDPQTGALECLLSLPNFDPNIFLKEIDQNSWQDLIQKNCFLNRALNACYPPASIFKLITLTAAVETNIIEPTDKWNCIGHTIFGNSLYRCNKLEGHGVVDIKKALAYSCNIPFFDIGKKIKIDTLAEFAKLFGLGQKTNIIFDEKAGLIPTSIWKFKTKGEPWWPGETLSASIGQSFFLVTPIQVARMVSAILQNYFVQPRILVSEPIKREPIKISSKTLTVLKKFMKSVIRKGTAKSLSKLENFEIYAKTGTAQTQNLDREKTEKKHFSHAWFSAYFKYKDYDPKTIVILIENAGSTGPAIRMAKEFFKNYAIYLDSKSKNIDQP